MKNFIKKIGPDIILHNFSFLFFLELLGSKSLVGQNLFNLIKNESFDHWTNGLIKAYSELVV